MELQILEALEQTLEGGEREQLRLLRDAFGKLAFDALIALQDWMETLGCSVLDDNLECQNVIERLTRLRAAATEQTPEEVLAAVVYGDQWQEQLPQMQEQEFPSWISASNDVIEPDVDDSLPQWADYYPNESDYLLHEYPEFINPDC